MGKNKLKQALQEPNKIFYLIPIILFILCLVILWFRQPDWLEWLINIIWLLLSVCNIWKYWSIKENLNKITIKSKLQTSYSRTSIITLYISLMGFQLKLIDHFYPIEVWLFLIIAVCVLLSIFMIWVNIPWKILLILFSLACFIIFFMGTFSIKQWALVSGILVLWNYMNSKNFLTLIRKGKKLDKIPAKIEYIWQRNNFLSYIFVIMLYITFLISPTVEAFPIVENLKKLYGKGLTVGFVRVLLLYAIVIFELIVYAIGVSIIPNSKTQKINKITNLPKWKKLIATYQVLQRKNNKN
ncbi:hypothetical protein AB6P06_09640 [Streptococcus mutans]|uniref:hypothetical protein n=1 Tax=Streptococcus mutans TaxID=1309 RepID=UPI0038B7BF8E